MARIVEDCGSQRVMREGAVVYASRFGMDCGCTIEVDLRGYLLRDAPLRDLVERTAGYHDCSVVVRPSPPGFRRRSPQMVEPRIRYLGMDLAREPDATSWLVNWQQEVLGSFAMPAPRPERSRGQPTVAPREAPEQVIRQAIAAPAEFNHQNPMGFQPDKKKQEDQPRPDRFLLIELD